MRGTKLSWVRIALFLTAVGLVGVTCVAPAVGGTAGHLTGTVTDDTTHLPMANVIVTAFDYRGSYVNSQWTSAAGKFTFDLDPGMGPYRLVYLDHNPSQIYAEQSSGDNGFLLDAATLTVSPGATTTCDAQMHKALKIAVVVHRTGYPETALSGIAIGCLYSHNTLQDIDMNITRNGAALYAGLPVVPSATWKLTAFDPSLTFGPPVSNDATSYPTSGIHVVEMNLPLADTSKDVVVSTPRAKPSVKRNKTLTFTGTFSKRVVSPKTLPVRAYRLVGAQWVLSKTVSAKVKAKKHAATSTYAGSVKLSKKGSWLLVAVFAGNSSYATTNSGYKSVTVQ